MDFVNIRTHYLFSQKHHKQIIFSPKIILNIISTKYFINLIIFLRNQSKINTKTEKNKESDKKKKNSLDIKH
jgi:hypothetical protein